MGGSDLSNYYKDSEVRGNEAGKNLPTIWLIGSEPHNFQKELGVNTDHSAIFPQSLCEIPIKFGTKPGDIVLVKTPIKIYAILPAFPDSKELERLPYMNTNGQLMVFLKKEDAEKENENMDESVEEGEIVFKS